MVIGKARHSVSVAAAIVNEAQQILVIRRRDNAKWEPPGGVLELEETIHEGLVREVLEETCLTVEPLRLSGVYKNVSRGIVALVFRCRILDGTPCRTDEAIELRWMSPEETRDELDEAYACRLLDALEEETAIRAHDGINLLATDFGPKANPSS